MSHKFNNFCKTKTFSQTQKQSDVYQKANLLENGQTHNWQDSNSWKIYMISKKLFKPNIGEFI